MRGRSRSMDGVWCVGMRDGGRTGSTLRGCCAKGTTPRPPPPPPVDSSRQILSPAPAPLPATGGPLRPHACLARTQAHEEGGRRHQIARCTCAVTTIEGVEGAGGRRERRGEGHQSWMSTPCFFLRPCFRSSTCQLSFPRAHACRHSLLHSFTCALPNPHPPPGRCPTCRSRRR
jgi:hypothetical protein